MIKFEKKVLDNGLRVILAPMETTGAVTMQIAVKTGSRNENKDINGVSHFLEHLFFKGTKRRPKAGQIMKELDRIGAGHNAFTSKEMTCFWVKTASKDFDVGLDILSDMFLNPIFKQKEIDKEKGVVLQEISMCEDDPSRMVWDLLENVAYGDQPMGWDILGTGDNIKKISRDKIIKYRSKNYLAGNAVVVVVGNFDASKVWKDIKNIFGGIRKGKNKEPQKTFINQNTPQVKIRDKKTDQTHMMLAFRAYDMYDERRYPLGLLSLIFGGNTSSRLWMEIREKLGLAYYVSSFSEKSFDCGYLGIAAGVAHENMEKTVKIAGKILADIGKKGISKKELDDAKSCLRGQTALSLESTDSIASYLAGRELFYNEIIQPEDELKKFEKVTQSDILKVARDIFKPEKINMAVIGKHENFADREVYYQELFKNF